MKNKNILRATLIWAFSLAILHPSLGIASENEMLELKVRNTEGAHPFERLKRETTIAWQIKKPLKG